MTTFRKHIVFYFSTITIVGGLLCLELHPFTHLSDHQTQAHQTASHSDQEISDNCALCFVSTFSFTNPVSQSFTFVFIGSEQIIYSAVSFLPRQVLSISAPRAPPASLVL